MNSDNRVLASCPGEIKPPIKRGQRLLFRYRIDENQILHFDLSLADGKKSSVVKNSLANPFTNIVNPNEKREEIDRIEEEIRNKTIGTDEMPDTILHLTDLYSDLNQHEKALGLLQALIAAHGADGYILNRMGMICGYMGDLKREEKFYLEAFKMNNDPGALFNLALSKKNQGKLDDALVIIRKAKPTRKKAPYLTLQAMILDSLGKGTEKPALLEEAFKIFDPVSTLDDWQLGWYLTASQLAGDKIRKAQAEAEQRNRDVDTNNAQAFGLLPEVRT
jgi:tetratricopeptide (TPR) repeat protein